MAFSLADEDVRARNALLHTRFSCLAHVRAHTNGNDFSFHAYHGHFTMSAECFVCISPCIPASFVSIVASGRRQLDSGDLSVRVGERESGVVFERRRGVIGVFVTFGYGDDFDEQKVREIAGTARARFEGMPGLHSKAFTLDSRKREATNFYIWDLEDTARAFFTDALLERITALYGVSPSVAFVEIATLVENGRA
jgi:hypothetical protein